jgi:hypothetical protein
MEPTRLFSIIAWILLPTVMFGGYALLSIMTTGNASEFQVTYFRAGHGHAGVLLLVALLYHSYLDKTGLSTRIKWAACTGMLVSALAVSGGFFLHMLVGVPEQASVGILVTALGAVLLTVTIFVLVYGLIKLPRSTIVAP